MKAIATKDAKNNFGELMNAAQRKPVTIERRGRPVAVIMSPEEFNKIKLERLRARLAVGEAQADRGKFSNKTADDIIRAGKQRNNAKRDI